MADEKYLLTKISSLERELLKLSQENNRLRLMNVSADHPLKNKKTVKEKLNTNDASSSSAASVRTDNMFKLLTDDSEIHTTPVKANDTLPQSKIHQTGLPYISKNNRIIKHTNATPSNPKSAEEPLQKQNAKKNPIRNQ